MIFKDNSEYAIYNPISEREWHKFFAYVDLNHLDRQQKTELIDKIKNAAQRNVVARKLVRRHINQKNPTTITASQSDAQELKNIGAGGAYSSNSDRIQLTQNLQVYAFFHELLHDQQNAMRVFVSNGIDAETTFSSIKLCEAEAVALNGTFSYDDINYLILKEQAIEKCKKNISKEQFKNMSLINDGQSVDEAYNVYIDIEATRLAMGQSILLHMQPCGEELVDCAERMGGAIQGNELFKINNESFAQNIMNWRNIYNKQSYLFLKQEGHGLWNPEYVVNQKKQIQNYFEKEYPFLTGTNYFQTGLNVDEAYFYGYNLKPSPLKVGTTINNETQIKTTIEKTTDGYVKRLTKNGVKLYDCYYNQDGFRNGTETFYNRNDNSSDSIFMWKNGRQIDKNGDKIALGIQELNKKQQRSTYFENITHMVDGLSEQHQVYRGNARDYIVDMQDGIVLNCSDIGKVSVDEINNSFDENKNQFDEIKAKLISIPTTGKLSIGEATYYPSGHLQRYKDKDGNIIRYESDGLNYYVNKMLIKGVNQYYYPPEKGKKIGKLKSFFYGTPPMMVEGKFREDGTLLSSTVGNPQMHTAQTTTYKADGKTIHSTGEIIFGKDLTEIKDGKWTERKGDTEICFTYNQNRIDNVDIIGEPKKAMSDILFADIVDVNSKEKQNIYPQKTIVTQPTKVKKEETIVASQKTLPQKTEIEQKNIEISPKVKKYKIKESFFAPEYSFSTENKYNLDDENLVWFEKDTDGNDISTSVVDLDMQIAIKGDGLNQHDVMDTLEQELDSLDEVGLLDAMHVGCGKSFVNRGVPSKKDGIKIETNKYNDCVSVCFIDDDTRTGKVFLFKKNEGWRGGYVLSAEGYGVFNGDNYVKHGPWVEYEYTGMAKRAMDIVYDNGKGVSIKPRKIGIFDALSNASNQSESFTETKKESALANSSVSVQDNADTRILDMTQNDRIS